MRSFTVLLLSFLLGLQLFAQREGGSWKDYLSYSNAIKVADSGSEIFCATDGGLFYLDTEDNSVNKVTGLSDFGIETMAYSREGQLLVLAYSNSNIDIIREGNVQNLSDIKRKSMTASKTIHNITFKGSEAYLSCGFGIVVVNLDRNEIKDTYIIGDDGLPLAVYDVEFFNNRIYAATAEGLLWAPESGSNLLDYTSWVKDNTIPHSTEPFTQLVVHNGEFIANYSNGSSSSDEAFILESNSWVPYFSGLNIVMEMESNGTYLTMTANREVALFDNSHTMIGKINAYNLEGTEITYINTRSALVADNGMIWIADYDNALIRYDGNTFESIFPNGPLDNEVFDLEIANSNLYIAPGGRNDAWNNSNLEPRIKRYSSESWTNFTKNEIPEMTGFKDIVCIAVDPADDNHFYAGSWGGGLLEFKNDELVNRYTNLNSPLETALPDNPTAPYVRIGGLDFDSEGNLWITNTAVSRNNLHKLTMTGDWESFTMSTVTNKTIGQVLVTENDDKWVLIPRGNDAYVVDRTGGNKRSLLVTTYFSSGNDEYFTRMSDVYSIAEDKEGAVWIGTSQGVAVYSSPSRIWESENFYASQPGLDLNDGIYHPLLSTETVTAIAIDGANRKWLGTSNSGVYLVSESGEEEVLHFTAENSPLLSNTIKSIAIDEKSGEVFFGTDKGLISYQGDAIGGKADYSGVYVYPNPVRETYEGPVTITGLISETDVKVTDIAGNLVYKTTSLGGQAVWDGRNLNGNRVKTGVYLVFCNDKFGEETKIAKLLFIH
ncbi:two-component regulator propeller domain-containing protein [Maribellus mangrovi]|uniref:type IX secretion system anionic LPS delivery protein PorZ n=1 Tax=Maribellus mangrovi TaxID=3133146 RepID=UPI0030EEB3A5